MLQTAMNASCQPDTISGPLKDVLDYLAEVVRLHEQLDDLPTSDWFGEKNFVLHQNEFDELPGITHDTRDEDGAVWLAVERLTARNPPDPDPDLSNWIDVPGDPEQRPRVRDSVVVTVEGAERDRLVAAEHARSEDCAPAVSGADGASGLWNVRLRLADHPDLALRLERFIADPWSSWAESERPRRRTMAVYQRLLDMVELANTAGKHRLVEFVWGIGLLRVRHAGRELDQPVLERLVEIEVTESLDGEIRIRPRPISGAANLKGLASLAPTQVRSADHEVERILEAIRYDGEISPFAPASFEPILNGLGVQLGSPAADVPERGAQAEEVSAPDIGRKRALANRWMIFARPRANGVLLRDLERLKDAIDRTSGQGRVLAGVPRVLALGPSEDKHAGGRQALSSVIGRPIDLAPVPGEDSANHGDLRFPLPSDDVQIEIVRRLEKADGLVVQAGAGIETTHALTNVICHHLALGQRVLVVSPEIAALARLRQRLPLAIRDLAIGPTGSDKERSEQIAAAIRRLQSIAETLRPHDQIAVIDELQREIVATRQGIIDIDEEVADIARRHLQGLPGFADLPFDVATRFVANPDAYSWFEDRPEKLLAEAGLSVAALDAVRDARIRAENWLAQIDDVLPSLAELPDAGAVVRLHADLRRAVEAPPAESTESGFARRVIAALGLEGANSLAADFESLSAAYQLLADEPWITSLSPLGKRPGRAPLDVGVIVDFARDVSFQLARRQGFSARPVETPTEAFLDKRLINLIDRLATRKTMLKALALRKGKLKPVIDSITVAGARPSRGEDWAHVREYLMWRRDIHALNARWKTLAVELGVPVAEADFPQTVLELQRIEQCIERAIVVPVVAERNVTRIASSKLAMPRPEIEAMLRDGQRLHALGTAIQKAATTQECARKDMARLKELFSGAGVLTASIRDDLLPRIGADQIDTDALHNQWVRVREQIGSLDALRNDFALIGRMSKTIAEAGAPRLAQRIRTDPANATGDPVIAPDWPSAWNWAVLTRQIDLVGERPRLRGLGEQRQKLTDRLCQLFEATVAARTHLALAQTMMGPTKQALTDFVMTLQRTGLSARNAIASRNVAPSTLEGCYQGIPCFITPAWQLAEQPEIGPFDAFDLVVVDDASHCDVRDLPALLRGRKVLVFGDGKEASSTASSFDDETIERLESRFLRSVPKTMRPFLLPGSSLYDLANVMFPHKLINLAERTRPDAPTAGLPVPREPRFVSSAPADTEPSNLPLGVHLPAERRKPRESTVREADVVVGRFAATSTTVSVVIAPRNPQFRSLGVPSLAGGPDLALIDPSRRIGKGEAAPTTADNIAQRTSTRFAARAWRSLTTIDAAEIEPQAQESLSNERPTDFEDSVVSDDTRDEATAPSSRSARSAKGATDRGDTAADAAAAGFSRQPAQTSELEARPLRPFNALAATLGTVSVIAAFSMFIALAVAVYGLFGLHHGSDGGTSPLLVPQTGPPTSSKIADRVAQSTPQSPSTSPVAPRAVEPPAAAVVQPAMLYEEDPSDPNGKQYVGTVTWQTDTPSPGPGLAPEVTVKADLEIPERRMSVTLVFRRNANQALPATHIFEIKFNGASDPAKGEISKVQGLAFKASEKARGTLLASQTAKVTPGDFVVALSAAPPDLQKNLKLLKEQPWFDIMFVYSNGNRAILAVQKGVPGEQALAQAFSSWGQ